MKFEPGTIVQLRSGGPSMVVSSLERADGLISCEWFAGSELKRDCFDAVNLTTAVTPFFPPLPSLPALPPDLKQASPFLQRGPCAACAAGGVCNCVRPWDQPTFTTIGIGPNPNTCGNL